MRTWKNNPMEGLHNTVRNTVRITVLEAELTKVVAAQQERIEELESRLPVALVEEVTAEEK